MSKPAIKTDHPLDVSRYFTIAEVAAILKVGPETIRDLIKFNGLEYTNVATGRGKAGRPEYRLSQAQLDALLSAIRKVARQPEPKADRAREKRAERKVKPRNFSW